MSAGPEIHGALTRWTGWRAIGCMLLGGALGYGFAALFHWLGMHP
mgnify:CR=1 FL=1